MNTWYATYIEWSIWLILNGLGSVMVRAERMMMSPFRLRVSRYARCGRVVTFYELDVESHCFIGRYGC